MKPIIVGLDPGTTTAYAVIDTEGKTIAIKSKKELDLDTVIKEITTYGKVVAVGTDKKKCPSFIEKFKARTGARLITAKQDLLVEDKRELTRNEKTSNSHEEDALAGAKNAYREIKHLIDKIKRVLKERKKEEYTNKVIEIMLKEEGRNINLALEILEKPEEPEIKIIKKAVEKKELKQEDFIELYDALRRVEKENKLIRDHNDALKRKIEEFETEIKHEIGMGKEEIKQRIRREMITKEHNINILSKEIQKKVHEEQELKKEIDDLNELISEAKDKIIIKKLDNLGWNEYNNKNRILKIKEEDILLVKNADIISENTIKEIKGKVGIIITEQKDKKIQGFITIDRQNLNIKENKHFAIIDKKELENEISKKQILHKIIQEYRQR